MQLSTLLLMRAICSFLTTNASRECCIDIYALRIRNVVEPQKYDQDFPKYVNKPTCRKQNAWSYMSTRDLGQICDLCVQKNDLRFQVFNATNDITTTKIPTKEFLAKICPSAPITREMDE